MNILRGKGKLEKIDAKIYNEENEVIPDENISGAILQFWSKIYQQHENNITDEWNPEAKEYYSKNYNIIQSIASANNHEICIPNALHEHYDTVSSVSCVGYMEEPTISTEDVRKQMMKIKDNKAPGPDGIKPDLLKIIGNDSYCLEVIATGLNNIIKQENEIPQTWCTSKTVLVPKKSKPTIRDLRPIALTNATYKLFMGILKTKIETHMRQICQESEVQAGFTKHRRITDNLFILDYCVRESYKNRKELFLISIDFAKAFDSIKRNVLIKVLKKYKIHPNLIDVIAEIYKNDATDVYFNGTQQCEINITSGIRQGCNGSSNLFLLVTYLIIEKMYDCFDGIKSNICKIVALFFADDGIILMQSLKETIDSIKILSEIADECGLSINKSKSNILIFNSDEQPKEINGIPVTTCLNYLGVKVHNKKDCFSLQREECLNKAKRYANLMPAVIAKSCNKLMIGKTYWKSAALPAILHGTEVIYLSKKHINKLQIEENKALRYTVHAVKCTAISALRGEIGTSLQESRDMKSKILFIKHIMQHNNLMKEILMQQYEERKPSKWMKQIKSYMKAVNINLYNIEHIQNNEIKKRVQELDNSLWKADLIEKSTLTLYRRYKMQIHDEQDIYDNTAASVTLFRARTNTLLLGIKRKHQGGDIICELCKSEAEDLQHFILRCTALSETRKHIIILQQPYKEDQEETIADLLLFRHHNEETIIRNRDDLYKLWKHRNKLLSQQQ